MACSAPRQYVVTLPLSGAITALLYGRTDSGTASDVMRDGVNRLKLAFPTVKQAGTDNPSGGVIAVFWADSDETPVLADAVQLFQLARGDDKELSLNDFAKRGYFYARVSGGTAAELHVTETR